MTARMVLTLYVCALGIGIFWAAVVFAATKSPGWAALAFLIAAMFSLFSFALAGAAGRGGAE